MRQHATGYLFYRQGFIVRLSAAVDPKRVFPTCSGTGIIWAFCRCGARFCGGFLPILPVQNGEKAIHIITKRVYDVSSHVPSCGAKPGYELAQAFRPGWRRIRRDANLSRAPQVLADSLPVPWGKKPGGMQS